MKFAAIVLCAGLVGTFVVSNLQGATIVPGEGLAATVILDGTQTGSVARAEPVEAIRLIDLQSGSTCKMPSPAGVGADFSPVPVAAECAGDSQLGRVAQWRSAADGALEMADADGRAVYRFVPGDGVLYESIYPVGALVTIVPAKG